MSKWKFALYLAVAIAVVPLAIAALLLLIGCGLVFMFIMWGVGYPLDITSQNKKIGHLRWFTFYPLRK